MATLESLEQEISGIKETMKEAIRMSRNPLSLFGKLDTLFHNCVEYENKFKSINDRLSNLETIKKKPGRPSKNVKESENNKENII